MKRILGTFIFLGIGFFLEATPHAYITNHNSGSVSVIDVATDFVQTIYGFSSPRVISVTPNGLFAYVGCDDNTIRIIDTSTNIVLPTIIELNQATASAITPNGEYLYIASNDDNVYAISTITNTIVDSVGGFSNIQDIQITPDNAYAYVSNSDSNTVSVIRTSDNTIVQTIGGFHKPLGLSISPIGDYSYVTNIGNNTVSVIQLSNNTIIDVIGGFNSPRYGAVTPDGDYVFVSDLGSNSIIIIQTSDNSIIDSIPISRPTSVALTPDGKFGYVASKERSIAKFSTSDLSIFLLDQNFAVPSNISIGSTNPITRTLSGFSGRDHFLTQTEYYHHIQWSPPSQNPIAYLIFRDGALTDFAGRVDGDILEFKVHNLQKHQGATYHIVALYENGFTSSIGSIQLTSSSP